MTFNMRRPAKIFAIVLFMTLQCQAWDDGKYSPKKYRIYDDGKYYRPLDEGQYIPGDEGKYTYIYTNTLYPAFPYKHQEGPSGNNNDYRGPNGGDGPNGGNGPNGGDVRDESDRIQYIGHRIYAERYPYIHKVIEALVDKYVSADLFGETPEGSSRHLSRVHADKETAVKCHYLSPDDKDKPLENTEFITQYPPRLELKKSERLGSFYGFKGSKVLSSGDNALKSKVKLEYEVFVRVVEVNE